MDRDEFMGLVYETFAEEPDNVLENGIIEAADAYVEYEKAQLSHEGTTSDLISRQAVLDAIDVLCQEHRYRIPGRRETYSEYNEAWQDALDRAEGLIFNLPPAQPEPHEGHWIGKYPTTHICSECGWLIPDSKVKVFAYCPNCGADMRGEQDE